MRSFLPLVGTALLLGLLVSAISFTLHTFREESVAQRLALAPSAQMREAAEIALPEPPKLETYASVTDRPIFSPTRRPGQIVEVSSDSELLEDVTDPMVSAEVVTELDDNEQQASEEDTSYPVLSGVLSTPSGKKALVSASGGELQWLALGDEIAGWSIKNISATSIEISRGSHELWIDLYEVK